MGSAGAASLVAHLGFWLLLAYGAVWGEIRAPGVGVFVGLWCAGLVGLPLLLSSGAALFPSWVAVLDIVLVFVIFKGDVKLT